MNSRPPLLGFRVSIALVLVATVVLMAAATVTIVVNVGNDAARKNAETLFSRISETVGERTDAQFHEPISLARYAVLNRDAAVPIWGDGRDHPFLGFMEGALKATPSLYSLYLGADDGTFFQLIHTRDDQRILAALQAPGGTQFVLRTIRGPMSWRTETWTFLGEGRTKLGQRVSAGKEVDFLPADRPWFENALANPGVVLSAPYVFASLKEPGVTASVALPGGKRVLGVDMTLSGLQAFIDDQHVSPRGGLLLLDGKKDIMARSSAFERRPGWLVQSTVRRLAGQDFEIVLSAPLEDFDAEFRTMEVSVIVTTAVLLLLLLPLTLLFTKRLTRIIGTLSQDVDRVCRLDFSGEAPLGSKIREFDRLARSFAQMKWTLAGETKVLADAQLKLKKIVETGIALSTEKNTEALNQKILDIAKELTDADGGTLYIYNEKEKHLDFNIMLNDTLGTRMGGTSDKPVPPGLRVKLYQDNGAENHHNVASHAFLTGETVNIVDAYDDDRFDFSGTRKFDEMNKYRSQSFLTVPLKPMGGEVLGCLQLINAKGPDGVTNVPFTPDMQSFVEALAASAATAIYNKNLLEDLEQLFDAIIDIINGAIGRKSPYTGGHCERVPIIATALAKATSAVTSGPLAGFRLDAKELREFVLAAKLHDVGKVTTPEYVVDKSTKLETIYNRIHEVRTRFEVLYRDAVIRRHETVLADKKKAKAADEELAAFKTVLDQEFEFLAKCNLGGEFLPPDKVERIRTIGARPWLRYFDDRLGLSWEEEERLRNVAPVPVPAPSTLLADAPIHIFPRHIAFTEAYKTVEGAPYPFKTPVPEVLYNQGEIYNLAIGRGTLTNEEHFKIKEHVMQSVYMLDRLPWPKGLEMVPVIAGEHHETLIGTGYPYQRQAAELSMQSRILTVADIFEALTASDRPYKKPKSLSEAVKVLYFFKKDRHIDADLFDLFLTSGVYLEYARKYLRPDQLDEVDIRQYLEPLPA